MSNKLEEVMKDVEELRTLVASASRKRIQDLLGQELRKMEIEVTQLQEAVVARASEEKPKVTTPSTYTVNLRTYSWDQSDKFTKLYITLKNIQSLEKDEITTTYGKRSMELKVGVLDGKKYYLNINNLAGNIKPDASYHKAKTDMLVVLLAKEDQGTKWGGVTSEDAKANEARKPKSNPEDPSGGIMDMMKQMYQDGDDKTKQMLNKTWYESQQKTMKGEGDGGMGGMMGGMGGMGGGMGGMGGGGMGGMGGGGMGGMASMMAGMGGMGGGMEGMGSMGGMPDMGDLGL